MEETVKKDGVLSVETLPVLPNSFPYNELLLSGKLSAKTREWRWKHTGLTLLYTSQSTEQKVADVHDLDPRDFPRGVIVGIGELLPVRENTAEEMSRIENEFANGNDELFPQAGPYRYEFRNLKRFPKPISFSWPRGAIRMCNVPVSLVAPALKQLGIKL